MTQPEIKPLPEPPLDIRVAHEFEFSPQLSVETLSKRLVANEADVRFLVCVLFDAGIVERTDCYVGRREMGRKVMRAVNLYVANQAKLAEYLNTRTKEWHASLAQK
jgi:DNA-binding Lrp family transcriptional regulator